MTANSPSPVAESASSTIDPDAQARRASEGELSAGFHSDVTIDQDDVDGLLAAEEFPTEFDENRDDGNLYVKYRRLAAEQAALRRVAALVARGVKPSEVFDAVTTETQIVRVATAATFVDRLSGCREALWRVVRAGREDGAVASGINALIVLGLDDFRSGQWDEAQRLLDEATELCDVHGYRLLTWAARSVQAALAGARGDYETTRSLADEMLQWATPRRARAVQNSAWQAQALAALGRGDFEEAYQYASKVCPAGAVASHLPGALFVLMDLVEAAVHTGRDAEATAHVAAIQESNIAALSSRLALVALGSAAIAATTDRGAIELFGEALTVPGADRWSFDLARVQLAYGERLRRIRAITDARVHLFAAIETFERLGARPWADRAHNELRATGQTKPRLNPYATAPLTPQERRIALLAASGLTNKQIAERLFLSPRTVGSHLHRLFPKLGIATRAALRDALAAVSDTQPGDTVERR
jgi:ATP/maltotriose-dependent transcriptional regulator MalT